MKSFLIVLILSLFIARISYPQFMQERKQHWDLLPENKELSVLLKKQSYRNADNPALNTIIFAFVNVINPLLIYENKKVNFGLTKEASIGFPLFGSGHSGTIGKLAFEYSYIFRGERNHHLRSSLNTEFPIQSSEFTALTLGIGLGYFTDFKKNGVFPQATLNLFLPFHDNFALYPYIKLRHTFMLDKIQSDNTDVSLGIGIMAFPFF